MLALVWLNKQRKVAADWNIIFDNNGNKRPIGLMPLNCIKIDTFVCMLTAIKRS